jgi:hypothetical protein
MPTTRRTSDTTFVQPAVITGDQPIRREKKRVDEPQLPGRVDAVRRQPIAEVGRGRRSEKTIQLGTVGEKPRQVGLSQRTGKLTISEKAGDSAMRDALAAYGAGELIEGGLELAKQIKGAELLEKVVANLERTLAWSLQGRSIGLKEKGFAGAMTTLLHLAKHAKEPALKQRIASSLLAGLERTRDSELRGFYTAQLLDLEKSLAKPERARLKMLDARVFQKAPLVEQYTANRTRPLEVRHFVHDEFWKEELHVFSKANGWKLVSRNEKDDQRIYRGVIKDPNGVKPDLQINMIVKKGELDYLDSISDPKVHVLTYSGHSSVGGNGGQAIDAAGKMQGEHPKLIFAANCRGKDNYAEFTNKWPDAHVIMTEMPTYSTNGQRRLNALFDTLAAGESYGWMRKRAGETDWDEPKNNYFYPDERRKLRFMDADEDGLQDLGALGRDRLFDVDARLGGLKMTRALAFANSELYYHWEVDHELGKKSHYGKKYGDALEAVGPFFDEKKGELLRVKAEGSKFLVSYAPSVARRMDENLLAGHVTMHAVMQLAKMRDPNGELSPKEALRAVLMGAQGIHYLDVYIETQPITYQKFFQQIGLTDRMDDKDIERIFEKFDAHANDAQVEALEKLLREKYGVDTNAWVPKLGRFDAVLGR